MKKIVLIYGLIAGFITVAMFFVTHPTGEIDFENGMLVGYATMVIAFSLIFFGVKNYRDNHLAGMITFGKAFKIGILVTLVASVVYALGWEVYFNVLGQNFMEEYSKFYIDQLAKEGATAQELEAARLQMQSTSEMYKNPLIRFAMTLMEIVPVGLVVTLICAALLRKQQFLPKEA